MNVISKHNGRIITVHGNETINFSTTGYLNLAHELAFQNFLIKGIKQYGHSYGSSPLTQPQFAIYQDLEILLAHHYDSEAALLFSTGFSASQAVMNHCVGDGLGVQYGHMHHPALHVPFEKKESSIFATDIVDPVNCQVLDKGTFPPDKPCVIDASHGFGIMDKLIREFAPQAVICGSLNKAFATPAGIVLCSKELKQELQKQPNYATSSAPSPAACFALLKAFETEIISKQQGELKQLLSLIPQSELYQFTSPLPVLKLRNSTESLYRMCLSNDMLIWHNEYPKHSGETLNRAVIHAGLTAEDVEKLLFCIET